MGILPLALAQTTDEAAAGALMAGVSIFWIILWFIILIGWLVAIGLGIWALIDVILRKFSKENDKTLWAVLIGIGCFLGIFFWPILLIIAIIYLITGRKKGIIPNKSESVETSK